MPKFPFWVDATDADDDDGCRRRFLKAEREREGEEGREKETL